MKFKYAPLALLAGLALSAGACSPIAHYEGFQAIDERPADVKVGEDTRSTVLAKLGSPTATSTFDKNVWFYISQMQSQTSFYNPKTLQRNIVAISFDADTEQVTGVRSYALQDGRVIAYNHRETPTRGREMSVIEQLIGSIGAGSALPPTDEVTPGSHPDDRH